MFQVGEVSRRLGINPQTLYFYERIGLIPTPKKTEAGYRLYDQSDLDRLSLIKQAKAMGFGLREIKEILLLQGEKQLSCQAAYECIGKKVADIEDKIEELQRLKNRLLVLQEKCQQRSQQSECVVFNK